MGGHVGGTTVFGAVLALTAWMTLKPLSLWEPGVSLGWGSGSLRCQTHTPWGGPLELLGSRAHSSVLSACLCVCPRICPCVHVSKKVRVVLLLFGGDVCPYHSHPDPQAFCPNYPKGFVFKNQSPKPRSHLFPARFPPIPEGSSEEGGEQNTAREGRPCWPDS